MDLADRAQRQAALLEGRPQAFRSAFVQISAPIHRLVEAEPT